MGELVLEAQQALVPTGNASSRLQQFFRRQQTREMCLLGIVSMERIVAFQKLDRLEEEIESSRTVQVCIQRRLLSL